MILEYDDPDEGFVDRLAAQSRLDALDRIRAAAREFGASCAEQVEDLGLLDLSSPVAGHTSPEVIEWARELFDDVVTGLIDARAWRALREDAGE